MYQDHTPLQAAGQVLLALAFLATGARNAGWKFRQHLDRMTAYGVAQACSTCSVAWGPRC